MKNFISFLLILTTSLSFSQQSIEQVDKLLKEEKYDTAFKLLDEIDPENQDPEYVLKKLDIALNYFVKSISHQLFAFKDLKEGEDLHDLREYGENQSFSMYMFPINEILDTLIIQHPNNYELYKSLGEFYYEVHLKYGQNWLIEESEVLNRMNKNFKIAAENGVSDYLTHYCLGYYQVLEESYDKAIPHFLKSIILDSTYPTSYYNLSICYLYTDQPNIGANYAVKSIDLYDNIGYKADAARVAAVLYKQIEDFDNALKYYKLSDQIQPGNYYTINQLLELQLELGLMKESEKTADSFFKLDPTNPRICSDLVEIYTITKKEKELLEFFNRKLEEYNSDNEVLGNIYFHIGQYHLSNEDKIKAKENFLIARKSFESILDKDHYVFEVIDKAIEEL